MATFIECDIDDFYANILKTSTEPNVLRSLYENDKTLFDKQTVEIIIKYGSLKEYKALDIASALYILKHGLFADYAKQTDPNELKVFDQLFNTYFRDIFKLYGKQPTQIKNKICALLKLDISIPSIQESFTVNHPTVHVRTAYTPQTKPTITSACDIGFIIQDQHMKCVQETPVETFIYIPRNNEVTLTGPVIHDLNTLTIQLQTEMLIQTASIGVQTKPFIQNSAIPAALL